MADTQTTDLPVLTSLAAGDVFHVIDVSDTTDDPEGSDKQITATNLAAGLASAGGFATDAEVTTAVSTHAGATDPHGDRAHASGLIATHEAASDPHPGYTSAAELATHAALTSSVHGISAFGATLIDDANAAAARATLELGGAATLAVGTTAGTVAAGDDSRLSNARTPTAHASSHADGGSDEIAVDASQITSGTVATARLGSGTANSTTFLRGDNSWAAPAGGSGGAELATHAALTSSVHGISAFGATLVDDASASAARTTLELGPLATASTITASSVTDFAETVRDTMGTALVAGSNVTITVSDPGDTITIASLGTFATDAEVTAAVAAHTGDSSAAHAASAISFTPAGTIAGTDVQTAVAEVATDAATALAAHEAASDPHPGYTTAAELATHAGLTSVHGISAFGATLVDDASASAARTTLELGPLATASTITASSVTDFAETVRDTMGTALVAGSNVTITVSDPGDTITIAASGGGGSSGTLSQRGQMSAYDATASFYGVPSFIITTANTTLTLVADTLYYFLFFVDSDITINSAALEVTNNIGTTIRHGIVRLDATDRQPNSSGLIWQTTVSSATTGLRSSTGLSVALTAGIYATLLVCDGAAGIRRARGALASTMFRFNATNAAVALASKPSVGTSAFSDPVPDWTAITVADIVDQPVGYRWS